MSEANCKNGMCVLNETECVNESRFLCANILCFVVIFDPSCTALTRSYNRPNPQASGASMHSILFSLQLAAAWNETQTAKRIDYLNLSLEQQSTWAFTTISDMLLSSQLHPFWRGRIELFLGWNSDFTRKDRPRMQCNAIQYNTIQDRTGQDRTGQGRAGQGRARHCTALQYRTSHYTALQCNAIEHNTTQHNTASYTTLHNAMQCNIRTPHCTTIHYTTLQYNATQ